MRKKETGKDYELIVKAIYDALLKLENVKNLEIRQNTFIKGISTTHQIDVYWKFRVGDLDYETIVQVKKEKSRASQGDVLLFSKVIDDIPGKPTGIFITRSGYQKGAINCASIAGIKLFQLSEVNKEKKSSVAVNTLSTTHVELITDRLAMRLTHFIPTVTVLKINIDKAWAKEYIPVLLEMDLTQLKFNLSSARFSDYIGNDLGSLSDRIREFVKNNKSSGILTIDISEPTFMTEHEFSDSSIPLERVKITCIDLNIDINQISTMSYNVTCENFTPYLLRNILEPEGDRCVLIGGDELEPKAIVRFSS